MPSVPATRQGGDVAVRSPQQELLNGLRSDTFKEQIQLALPPSVTVDKFVRVAITAIQASPDIADADRDSVIRSLLLSAQMGLYPDGTEAAIVIFNSKVKQGNTETWVKKAQLIPMIGGFRKIAGGHGWVIRTAVVYTNDRFEYELGLNERLVHVPVRPGATRGDIVAAYAVGVHKGGRREFEVLTLEDMEKVRAASRAGKKGPWVDWTERMYEKTAGRRLFKKLPLPEDDDRVTQVSQAPEFAPGETVAALYGSSAAALPQGGSRELAPAQGADGSQQTGETTEPSPRVSPVPGDDEQRFEDAPPWPDEPAFVDMETGEVLDGPGPGGVEGTSGKPAGQASESSETVEVGPSEDPGPRMETSGQEVGLTGPGPSSIPDSEVAAADAAAAYVIPDGKHKGKTLTAIHIADPDWFRWALANVTKPPAYQIALWRYAKVYVHEAYQEAMAQQEIAT